MPQTNQTGNGLSELFGMAGERLVFGCEQLGGYEWGAVDAAEITQAIALAIDSGVCFFDTADCYGRGVSEVRLGKAIKGKRNEVLISTKGSVRLGTNGAWYDNSRLWLEEALNASLVRLGTDYVDLYQMHHWDKTTPLEDICETMELFRSQGKIRSYALANVTTMPEAKNSYPGLAAISLEYSLACRDYEDAILGFCARGHEFLPFGCLAQGLLSGKYMSASDFSQGDRRLRAEYKNFHGDRLQRNLRIIATLKELSSECGTSMASYALAWVRHNVGRSIPIVGIKRVSQLLDAVASLDVSIGKDAMDRLELISSKGSGDEAAA